ncbi:MAG: S1C family serine protease [Elusimicrobia bacterium]|nr:S1C family serine protease [Candidatus Obscuribacterium magneticum]
MQDKPAAWILVLVLSLGLVYVGLIVFRRSFVPHAACFSSFDGRGKRRFQPAAFSPNTANVDGLIQHIRPAVVGIRVGSGGNGPNWQTARPMGQWSVGSGVIVNPKGYIVTNFHVVASGSPISIAVFSPAGAQEVPAQLIGKDETKDLALLKIAPSQVLVSMPIGDSASVRVGDQVTASSSTPAQRSRLRTTLIMATAEIPIDV